MAMAVRHDTIRAEPVQMTGPLKKPRHVVKVLSSDELPPIRRMLKISRSEQTIRIRHTQFSQN